MTVHSFVGAAASHAGLVRRNNEDSGFAGPGLLVVADGVGGHAAGEVASATATYVLSATALGTPGSDPGPTLRAAVALAQQQVALGARHPDRHGMATTLTAVLTDGVRASLLQLGDSRAYLVRGGRLARLSRDHTVVQQLVDDGVLRPEEAAHHPWSHVVTRTLGGDPRELGDLVELDLQAGDRLLLCSDGLTDLVDDPTLAGLLREHPDDARAVDALVQAALAAGGKDNVTAILATVTSGAPQRHDGSLVGAARDPRLVVDPAAVRLSHSA